MSPIILRCLYTDVQYLLQVGVAGSALPTHQCFSHVGSGKILPMPLSLHALQFSPMSFAQLIAIYAPKIYTAPSIMFWMRAYKSKWEGVGPWKSQFPGPKPFPLTQVMDMNASTTLCTGMYYIIGA
jgi:hypothetical protein